MFLQTARQKSANQTKHVLKPPRIKAVKSGTNETMPKLVKTFFFLKPTPAKHSPEVLASHQLNFTKWKQPHAGIVEPLVQREERNKERTVLSYQSEFFHCQLSQLATAWRFSLSGRVSLFPGEPQCVIFYMNPCSNSRYLEPFSSSLPVEGASYFCHDTRVPIGWQLKFFHEEI